MIWVLAVGGVNGSGGKCLYPSSDDDLTVGVNTAHLILSAISYNFSPGYSSVIGLDQLSEGKANWLECNLGILGFIPPHDL